MPVKEAKNRFKDSNFEYSEKRMQAAMPVIFFETMEIAWMPSKQIKAWRDGLQVAAHLKQRTSKRFRAGLMQVSDFFCRGKAPRNWVSRAPAPVAELLAATDHSTPTANRTPPPPRRPSADAGPSKARAKSAPSLDRPADRLVNEQARARAAILGGVSRDERHRRRLESAVPTDSSGYGGMSTDPLPPPPPSWRKRSASTALSNRMGRTAMPAEASVVTASAATESKELAGSGQAPVDSGAGVHSLGKRHTRSKGKAELGALDLANLEVRKAPVKRSSSSMAGAGLQCLDSRVALESASELESAEPTGVTVPVEKGAMGARTEARGGVDQRGGPADCKTPADTFVSHNVAMASELLMPAGKAEDAAGEEEEEDDEAAASVERPAEVSAAQADGCTAECVSSERTAKRSRIGPNVNGGNSAEQAACGSLAGGRGASQPAKAAAGSEVQRASSSDDHATLPQASGGVAESAAWTATARMAASLVLATAGTSGARLSPSKADRSTSDGGAEMVGDDTHVADVEMADAVRGQAEPGGTDEGVTAGDEGARGGAGSRRSRRDAPRRKSALELVHGTKGTEDAQHRRRVSDTRPRPPSAVRCGPASLRCLEFCALFQVVPAFMHTCRRALALHAVELALVRWFLTPALCTRGIHGDGDAMLLPINTHRPYLAGCPVALGRGEARLA
jgi:hypothetical protein